MTPLFTSALLSTQSDERLVLLVRDGQERAFDAIVDRYRKPLQRYCERALPESRAEDVVQQVLTKAWCAFRDGTEVRSLSVPGREVIQNRVDIGPEAPFVKHKHPGEEIIYVLEGTLEYHVDGQTPTTLEAGDVLLVPAETVHAVRNVGSGNAAKLATYVVEKGKPFLVVVE
jgi:quercetin dioxygenase-like cupin family protein